MKTTSQLVESYRKTGILLDSNILLLYFVGSFDKQKIATFKRTKTFAVEDFDTLLNFMKRFEKVVTLPNILTEVSNLLGEIGQELMPSCFQCFAYGIDQLLQERYSPSRQIAGTEEFKRFGLTDAAILDSARAKYLVLTDDFRLSGYLEKRGVDALNFNHIRVCYWT